MRKTLNALKIERNFPLPPQKVFAFITQKENLLKWWGPVGTSIGDQNLDLSKTGPWWFELVMPTGARQMVTGEVLLVDPPRLVEFTLVVPDDTGDRGIDSVVRFEVSPDGVGGSHFLLTQTGLSDEEIVTGSTQGWVSTLSRLDRLLRS